MFKKSQEENKKVLVISAGLLLENVNANKVLFGFIWEAFSPVCWKLLTSCGTQYAVMFHQFTEFRNQFCQGEITSEDFRGKMNAVVGKEIPDEKFWQIWNSMLENVPHFDEISEKFEWLKSQYAKVIVVSDTNDKQVNYLKNKKGYGPLFENASLSYEKGKLKVELLCDAITQAQKVTSEGEIVVCHGVPRGPEKERLEEVKEEFLKQLPKGIKKDNIVYVQQSGIDRVLAALSIENPALTTKLKVS